MKNVLCPEQLATYDRVLGLKPLRPVPQPLPISQGEWRAVSHSCHAPTTIVLEVGANRTAIAECSGFGLHSDDCVDIAAHIVRCVNSHAGLLDALQAEEEWRAREAAGAIDPEWDYEVMVGNKRRAAIARAVRAA